MVDSEEVIGDHARKGEALPVRLTERVLPLGEIRRRRVAAERPRAAERLHRFLHDRHSFLAAAALFTSLYGMLVGGAVLYACWAPQAPKEETDGLAAVAASLGDVAGAVGGISAILFAAVVFGLEFHGGTLGKASFFIRYLARRHGVVPLAALALAEVAANATVAMLGSHRFPRAAAAMATANLVLIPGALLATLWLFRAMVVSVAGDFFRDDLLPALEWEYARAADEQEHAAELAKAYGRLLEQLGVTLSPFARLDGLRTAATVVRLQDLFEEESADGEILDVNVPFLAHAVRVLRSAGGEVYTDAQPGRSLRGAAFWASGAGTLSVGALENLRGVLREAIVIGRRSHSDLPEVLDRFGATLVAQAAHDDAEQLARALEVAQRLLELQLDRASAPALSWMGLAGQHPYFKMAAAAAASGDASKVSAVVSFARRAMLRTHKHRNERLFTVFGQVIEVAYWRAARRAELADRVGEEVDDLLGTTVFAMHLLDRTATTTTVSSAAAALAGTISSVVADVEKEAPFVYAYVLAVLRLVRAAVDLGRARDAENFHHRLFQWDEYHRARSEARYNRSGLPRGVAEAVQVHQSAELVLAGWCVRKLRRRAPVAEVEPGSPAGTDTPPSGTRESPSPDAPAAAAAARVLRAAAATFSDRGEALDAWLRAAGDDRPAYRLEELFQLHAWDDDPTPGRTMVFRTTSGPLEWIDDGFWAVMLASPGGSPLDDDLVLAAQNLPKTPELVSRLRSLADHPAIADALGLQEDRRQRAIAEVSRFVGHARRSWALAELRRVVLHGLGEAERSRLKDAVDAASHTSRRLTRTLHALGAGSGTAPPHPTGTVVEQEVSRLLLVAPRQAARNTVARLAQALADREGAALTAAAARATSAVGIAASRAAVRQLIARACDELRAAGYTPSALFLPAEDRLLEAAGTTPRTRPAPPARLPRASHGYLGSVTPAAVDMSAAGAAGGHDLLHVLESTHPRASELLVVDLKAFFGTTTEGSHPLALDVYEETEVSRREYVARIERASQTFDAVEVEDDDDERDDKMIVPEVTEPKVRVVMSRTSGLSVGDPAAGRRLELDLRRIGYAVQEAAGPYHRPECASLDPTLPTARGLVQVRRGRPACDRCRPDRWASLD
jgi:hypothetical protein